LIRNNHWLTTDTSIGVIFNDPGLHQRMRRYDVHRVDLLTSLVHHTAKPQWRYFDSGFVLGTLRYDAERPGRCTDLHV
jgi:hypothetical protein